MRLIGAVIKLNFTFWDYDINFQLTHHYLQTFNADITKLAFVYENINLIKLTLFRVMDSNFLQISRRNNINSVQ